MSTRIPAAPEPSEVSASTVALWVLFIGSSPVLLPLAAWMLHQPLIALVLLLLTAAWTWKPKQTKRALLVGAALAHQTWTRRRQTKNA